jgi:Holliday junction resolvase RusA-like endonuclease
VPKTAIKPKPKPRKPFPSPIPGLRRSFEIPDWRPATVNQIYGNGPRWWRGAKLKKLDKMTILAWVPKDVILDPKRPLKRRVHMHLIYGKGERRVDNDNVWKSVLDALKHAGVIFNDSPTWCSHSEVTDERREGIACATVIIIEDI